jgi:hypothetical protein
MTKNPKETALKTVADVKKILKLQDDEAAELDRRAREIIARSGKAANERAD